MAPPKRRLHSERNMADERVGQSSRKRLVNEIAKKLGREPGEDWKMILWIARHETDFKNYNIHYWKLQSSRRGLKMTLELAIRTLSEGKISVILKEW